MKTKCAICGHEYDAEQHKSCPECAKKSAQQGIDVSEEALKRGLQSIDTLVKSVEELKRENAELKAVLKKVPEGQTKHHFSGGEPGTMDMKGETIEDTFKKIRGVMKGEFKNANGESRVRVKMSNMYHKDVYGRSKGLTAADWDQMGGLIQPTMLPMRPTPGFGRIGEKIMQYSKIDFSGSFADQPAMNISSHGSSSQYGGITFTKVAENTGVGSQAAPAMQMIKFSATEHQAEALLSKKLMQNAPNAEAVTLDAFRKAFEYHLGYQCFGGTGTGEPLGWKVPDSTFKVERDTADTISEVDLRTMFGRLFATDPGSLFWFISWCGWSTISGLEDTNGNRLYMQDYSQGMPPTVMNIPVIWAYETPYLGTEGDANLVDLSQYGVALGDGLEIFASEHRYAEKRAIYYVIYYSVDAKPLVTSKIALADQAAASGDDASGFLVSPQVILSDPAS